jgi:hypothetical protein
MTKDGAAQTPCLRVPLSGPFSVDGHFGLSTGGSDFT